MNIGIDLGTTNSALAYIDPNAKRKTRDFPPIHIFETSRNSSPPDASSRAAPCRRSSSSDERPACIGVYAREQGALVPTKLVHSAKIWLSNPDVDRTAKILPWDAQEAGRVLLAGRSLGALSSPTSARGVGQGQQARRSPNRTSCSPSPPPSTKRPAS